MFLFYDIRFDDAGIITNKCKEVLLLFKAYKYY